MAAEVSLLTAKDSRSIANRSGVNPILRHRTPNAGSPPEVPAGLQLVDWRQIKSAYERHRHGMFADGQGGYQSRSHYHGWLVRFDGKRFEVDPDTQSWTWSLELVRWGRAGRETAVAGKADCRKDGNRLEYRRKGITEWFVNGQEGLEHGFTIAERPEQAGSGELSLQLRQRGALVAELDAEGRGVTYKTAQGGPALRYRKLVVTDAHGRRLAARILLEGEGLRILVDDRRAVYPIVVDPIAQQAYLKASNTESLDCFGISVAISGETVVVGAPLESSNATGVNGTQSDNSASKSGAAYVFVRRNGTWTQQAYLKASNTDRGDHFGGSVAISGDTVLVGAYFEASNATGVNGNQNDNSAHGSGAAYVFVRNSGTWTQQTYLKASNTNPGDHFGWSVAISGDTMVVGAILESSNATGVNGNQHDNSADASGAAYVFARSSGTWTQQAYLKASNTGAGDHFSYSVAISEDTVVGGAWREASSATGVNGTENDNSAWDSGAVYVFVRSNGTWRQQAYLKASNTESYDFFGISVAISGDTVLVGAYLEASNATGVNGNQNDNSAYGSGAAYVFVRSSGAWTQQAYLKASNSDREDYFGSSVAISGDTVVVGATGESSNATGVNGNQNANSADGSGAAYVFVRSGGSWAQQAYLKASNTDRYHQFGRSVAMAPDTVVVGALGEAGNATRVNGNQDSSSAPFSGAAYVFEDAPRVAAISPSSGPSDGGQSVTITGTNFTGATAVTIGGATVPSFTVLNSTTITATTPAGSAGTASVLVTTLSGTNTANALYTYQLGAVTLSPATDTASAAGATSKTVTVTANAAWHAWTATSNVPWLTVTAGAAATGSGTVTYRVAANGGNERVGTLTIAGRTFTVSQGAQPEIVLPQLRIESTFAAGDQRTPLVVEVAGTPGLEITVRSLVPWLEVTPHAATLPAKLTITPSAQLKPDSYLGVVALLAVGLDPVFLSVRLTVTEPPQFIALPTAIQLEGSSTSVLYVTSRGRQVRYEAEAVSEGAWLSVQPESGLTPVNLRVTANAYFLKPGVHTGSVRIRTREAGGGGPITIPVTVTVPAQGQ